MLNPSQKLGLLAMLQQKQLLPRSVPSQNLRWQKPNRVHHANHAIQMPVAALNHRALKYAAQSAVMTFGILPENHSARVAKSQAELEVPAIDMKRIAQLARRASTTTKHQLGHHAPVAMMHQ
jgi:hypothetical protein